MSAVRLGVLIAFAGLAAGCTSQWFPGFERKDIATTDVVVRSEPPGATIFFNGTKLPSPAPVRQPIKYDHTETLYERQNNFLGIYHYKQDLRRHVYGNNRHSFEARLPGHWDTPAEVTLEGEAEVTLTIKLPKRE